jgi:uncharacterized protein (DUF1330 family)
MNPAYLIGDVYDIHDLERFRGYNRDNPPTIAQYGGQFIVRGGATEVIEGQWQPGRLVVIRFDSMEALKRWYSSPEYRKVWSERQASARSNIVFVEGVG